jgi:cell wall-associated NlpC family hydrolase
MLTAPERTRSEPVSVVTAAQTVGVQVRHRCITGAVAVVTAAAVAGALFTRSGWLWLAALIVGVLGTGHLAMVARLRHLMAAREMSAAFGVDPTLDWDAFGRSLSDVALAAEGAPAGTVAVATTMSEVDRELVRFVGSWALGVVLTPIVVLAGIIGLTRADPSRHQVVERLVRAQVRGRSQSLRVVAAGLVATAGVTAGAVGAVGASAATPAAPVPAATTGRAAPAGPRSATLQGSAARVAARAVSDHFARPRGGAHRHGLASFDVVSVARSAWPPLPGGSGRGIRAARRESVMAARAMSVALAQIGKPYVYGTAGPSTFDCSGLMMYAYAAAGVLLTHNAASQFDETSRITEAQLLPGDLVFYDSYGGGDPGHVAMYIGHEDVVSANQPGTYIQTQSISYDGSPIGFGRVR